MTTAGFTIRPLSLDDVERYVDTENAIAAFIGVKDRIGSEIVLLEWQEPGFNIADSSIAYFDNEGRLAGYATFWATAEKPVRPGLHWGVHPAIITRASWNASCWAGPTPEPPRSSPAARLKRASACKPARARAMPSPSAPWKQPASPSAAASTIWKSR